MADYTNDEIAERIDNGMGFHPGNADVAPIYETLRVEFVDLGHLVNKLVPDGSDKTLAVIDLEDGLMRAIRGVATNLTPLGAERRQ